jgi:hypothetical protein
MIAQSTIEIQTAADLKGISPWLKETKFLPDGREIRIPNPEYYHWNSTHINPEWKGVHDQMERNRRKRLSKTKIIVVHVHDW